MNKFIPKNYVYKKIRKRVRTNVQLSSKLIKLKFYKYGLKALTFGCLTSEMLEAARRSITRRLKRSGRLKINAFAYVPVTAKSLGVRMGKGVGSLSNWVFPVRPGRILFELSNVSFDLAKVSLIGASKKLPIKTKFIYK